MCSWCMVNNEENWLPWQIKDWFNKTNIKSPKSAPSLGLVKFQIPSPQRVNGLKQWCNNMKILIILSHSWSPLFLLTYLYGENVLLWGPVHPFGVFSRERTRSVSRQLICNEATSRSCCVNDVFNNWIYLEYYSRYRCSYPFSWLASKPSIELVLSSKSQMNIGNVWMPIRSFKP